MKRTPLIFSLIVIIALTAFFLYKSYYSERTTTIWDIISDQTVLVFEVGECTECVDQIQQTVLWSVLQKNLIAASNDGESEQLWKMLVRSADKLVVSLHITKKNDFDFVYYLPLSKTKGIETFLNSFDQKKSKISQRELNGIKINEVRFGNRVFSWMAFEDIWVASFTPFLIEDVIRTYKSEKSKNFGVTLSGVQLFPKVNNDAGNLYLNLEGVSQWLLTFLQEGRVPIPGQASLLDIKSTANHIALNGFSSANEGSADQLLSYFYDQSPVSFTLKQYASARTLAITSFGVTDGKKLFSKLPISKNRMFLDSIRLIGDINPEELYSGIGKEIAVCYLEGRENKLSKILMLSASNVPQWLNTFDRLSQVTEKEDSLYFEQYSNYEIKEIDLINLPEKLFKPLVNGFERTYYCQLGNTLLLAERVDDLRNFLDDIDREEVWGKSVAFNQYLESTLLESNLSVYINPSRAYGFLQKKLNEKWGAILAKPLRSELNTISFAAIQFSSLNNSFYTNVSFILNDQNRVAQPQPSRIQANLDNRIIKGPFVVLNHATRRNELVVQDSTNILHYFSLDGKRLWKRNLQEKIIDRLDQVDYLGNNKLQLFFLADGKLEIIDRLGNPVAPFPIAAPNQPFEFVQVVDYDNSKRYRYLLTEKSGKLWLLDKEGKNLDGWKPRVIDGPLLVSAQHHRIRGKDFIVAIRKDGVVHLFNRRGEDIKGFPLNLENKPAGGYFLESGNTVSTTNFVIVTKDGIKLKFNVEGKVVTREPLVKTSVDDVFSLAPEHTGKSFIIARQNSKQFELLNEQNQRILINDFVGKNAVDVQYYDFGSGRMYYVLADATQDLVYIYDAAGQLLTSVPIEAESVVMFLDAGTVYYAASFEDQLTIQPVQN